MLVTHAFTFEGLLQRIEHEGEPRLVPHAGHPTSIPCPTTGHALRIAAIDTAAPALCPSCMKTGYGAFLSFVADLRMAYACPQCEQMVWVAGS